MPITKNSVVSFDYTLTDNAGKVLDTSSGRSPLVYMHGAGNIIPGLESQMEGKNAGDAFQAKVPPEQAYGVKNDQLIQAVPRTAFPANQMIMVGQEFQARGPNGQAGVVRVVKVEDNQITVDANHPLAGVELTFDVKIVDVRDATPDEIAHGHVHGPGGHHH
ncbi:MAG: peptidylprolyl isomerase [Tepidisphaeraceae bacterium]